MPLMCDECKCSTYYNEDTDLYSCENECPCCNDPEYVSDSDKLIKLIEYIKIHKISLEQDSEEVERELDKDGLSNDEYTTLDIQSIRLNGQISALSHILEYIDNDLTKGVE